MTDFLRHPYEYAIRYRRANWPDTKVRFFHRESQALKYRRKLMAGHASLAPVVELTIERRQLGPVEVVFDVNELA